jgi:hypothetical protein
VYEKNGELEAQVDASVRTTAYACSDTIAERSEIQEFLYGQLAIKCAGKARGAEALKLNALKRKSVTTGSGGDTEGRIVQ